MKKLRMIVTSVIVLAIVSSAFTFKANKLGTWCYSTIYNPFPPNFAVVSTHGLKRVAVGSLGSGKYYYIVDWDGTNCSSLSPTVATGIIGD